MTKKSLKEEYGMLEFCLKFPYSNTSSKYGTPMSVAVATFGIPFILPIFLLAGYLTRVRRAAYHSEPEVPKVEYYGELIDEGKGAVISQLPVIFISLIGVLGYSLLQIPFFFSLFFISIFLSPIAAMQYALKGDYKKVYDKDFANVVSSPEYIKYYIIYSGLLIFTIFLSLSIGSATLGIGLFLLLPTVVVSRAAYWGYVYEMIEE